MDCFYSVLWTYIMYFSTWKLATIYHHLFYWMEKNDMNKKIFLLSSFTFLIYVKYPILLEYMYDYKK